jgi:two-component sensor histidine kinase
VETAAIEDPEPGGRPERSPSGVERRELDHRLANSLQLAADFLLLQQARIRDPFARAALIDAAERMVAVGHLHRFLCAHEGEGAVDLRDFMAELAALIQQGAGLRCQVEAPAVRAPAWFAQQLGLIVNEIAMNAAKHAYPKGGSGVLHVQARASGQDLVLIVRDDGPGLPAGFSLRGAGGAGGFGLEIMHTIARQLGGRLDARSEGGAVFILETPLPSLPVEPRSFAPK